MKPIAPLVAAAFLSSPPAGGAPPEVSVGAVRVLSPEYAFEAVAPSRTGNGPPALVFGAERPTPGYRVEVASVLREADGATIVARIVVVPPEGMVAQVVTRSSFTIELPELPPGTYAFRLEKRREGESTFAPAIALTLTVASPSR